MTTELSAVYEELVRLKAEGEERIYMEDKTLELLKPPSTPQPAQAQLSQELQQLDLRDVSKMDLAQIRENLVKLIMGIFR